MCNVFKPFALDQYYWSYSAFSDEFVFYWKLGSLIRTHAFSLNWGCMHWSQEIYVIHENPWKSMKIHENPWKSMKIHENPWRYGNAFDWVCMLIVHGGSFTPQSKAVQSSMSAAFEISLWEFSSAELHVFNRILSACIDSIWRAVIPLIRR